MWQPGSDSMIHHHENGLSWPGQTEWMLELTVLQMYMYIECNDELLCGFNVAATLNSWFSIESNHQVYWILYIGSIVAKGEKN